MYLHYFSTLGFVFPIDNGVSFVGDPTLLLHLDFEEFCCVRLTRVLEFTSSSVFSFPPEDLLSIYKISPYDCLKDELLNEFTFSSFVRAFDDCPVLLLSTTDERDIRPLRLLLAAEEHSECFRLE